MKDKKQELEFGVISDETKYEHKILSREVSEKLTNDAKQAIESEDMDMS